MECRICQNNIKEPFFSFGNLPLANSFISKENLYNKEEYYPLDLYFCERCKLVQVNDSILHQFIFSPNYIYYSGYSFTYLEHVKNYVDMIIDKLKLKYNSKIIEVGSNDGSLLQYFKQHGIENIKGVEPASDAADIALSKGIQTDKFFFNKEYINSFYYSNSKYNNCYIPDIDLIIGNNVLAHNPNLNEFICSMKKILKSNGTITLEFPYLLNIIEFNQFDTIYHEHFSYFSFNTIKELFEKNDLRIYDVEEILIHGGSLRIYVKHINDDSKKINNNVKFLLKKEELFSLYDKSIYDNFAKNIINLKKEILQFLINVNKSNKKIVCYGAPAKGNTLLNYCGIGKDFIEYTVDLNPSKQGKYLPGTHIPVYHPDKIKEDKPDYIIILPWNIKNEIIKQLRYVREWNCKFVTLIPNIEIF